MGLGKSVKKFFKKNLRDIATVVGFAVGGPAGAAIGQGIGSVGEGRSLQDSLTSAAKVYGGANIATGFGITPETITPGSGNFLSLSAPTATQQGIGGFFQNLGSMGSNALLGTAIPTTPLGLSFSSLTGLQKLGALGTGAAMLGGMGEQQGTASMPAAAGGQYLTQGLRPATVSDVYGTASGLPSASTTLASAMPGAVDPITQTYLQMLAGQDEDYGTLAFPEFSQQELMAAKDGGVARLADGGAMPEVDLRNSGGGLSDPEGSGNKDTIPALLADGEFVMTKQAVKGIGNGDHNRGIEALYAMMDFNENKAQNMGIGRA